MIDSVLAELELEKLILNTAKHENKVFKNLFVK